jgi:hypothetical protein
MSNLLIKSKLFWNNNGKIEASWYLGLRDGANVAEQDAYIRYMDKWGADTICLNILNDSFSSPFSGQFMRSVLDDSKVNLFLDFIKRLQNSGKNIFFVFTDSPPGSNPKYPFWNDIDKLTEFIKIVSIALAQYATGFIVGIETDRGPLSCDQVEAAIGLIGQYAVHIVSGQQRKIYIGAHEVFAQRNDKGQLYMRRRVPRNADFVGIETMNHPVNQGQNIDIAAQCAEVKFILANAKNSKGEQIPGWVIENSAYEDDHTRLLNRALAKIDGVYGVNVPA